MDKAKLIELAERCEKATGPNRELDAEIMFDLYAKPIGTKPDGGPVGYLWPEDNPSWNFGLRFPNSTRESILEARKRCEGETLMIERDDAIVLMNDLRIPAVTASIDAALTLAGNVPADDILREAMSRLAKQFALHMRRWPANEDYRQWLAKFICAAAMRALAEEG